MQVKLALPAPANHEMVPSNDRQINYCITKINTSIPVMNTMDKVACIAINKHISLTVCNLGLNIFSCEYVYALQIFYFKTKQEQYKLITGEEKLRNYIAKLQRKNKEA